MATIDRRGVSVDATDSAVAGDPNPGLAIKVACRVATTASITLSGLQTIDDVAVAAGDRVLVKDQTDATQNGIYNASTGPWTRANDADGNTELATALQVLIVAGTLNGGYRGFVLTSPDPITIGTSAIVWQALSYPSSAIEFVMDGGGAPITAGYKGIVEVPFDCLITRSTFLADIPGSIVMDVRKTSYANFPPGPADSIVGATPPTLAAQQSTQDTALTDWTLALRKGDLLAFYVSGLTTVGLATLSLLVTRN
ncbi:MAG: hypothetical protein V4673_14590 [Pseudomonadota bacterium]